MQIMASLDADQEAEMEAMIRELEAENRYNFNSFCGRESCKRCYKSSYILTLLPTCLCVCTATRGHTYAVHTVLSSYR
jgi:hypothetical protein